MRATIGRVAVVVVSSISVTGCTSGPSWSSLSWWHKKPDATAVAEAPKFTPGAPALPTANQNPNNSLANLSRPAAAMAAAGANPAAPAVSYGAPAAYQNTVYPTTPYQQAKLPPAASASATTSAGTPSANAWATSGANPWTNGAQAAAPNAVANSAMPSRYAPAAASAAPATAVAAATPYGAPPVGSSPGQPQTGFYNPTYDGGGSANRYLSGAAIPGYAPPPANMTATAVAQAPASSMPGNSMPGAAAPNYRTADTRSSMASGMPSASGAESTPASMNNTTPGDRYAGFAGAPSAQTITNPVSAPADRYAAPSVAPASAPYAAPGMGDRYAQPTSNVQPSAGMSDQGSTGYPSAAMANPTGSTGYSSPDASAGAGMSSLPARNNSDYRPGGTGNYVSPAGSSVQPASGVQPDSHSQGASPASFQSADASGTSPGVVHALHTSPVAGSEIYGSYQGGTSPATRPTDSFGSSNSEPAYGAPNPVAATPALLQSSSN